MKSKFRDLSEAVASYHHNFFTLIQPYQKDELATPGDLQERDDPSPSNVLPTLSLIFLFAPTVLLPFRTHRIVI